MSTNNQAPTVISGVMDIASYVSLFHKVVDLKALIETEKTRREEIEKDYMLKAEALMGEIRAMELALTSDIRRREEFTTVALSQFEKLLETGQTEVAMIIFQRVADSFDKSTLNDLIDYRKEYASTGIIDIKIR